MSEIQRKHITLKVLRDYHAAIQWGDVPDYPLALYTYLLMDGYLPRNEAAKEVRTAISPPIIRVEGETQ